MSDNINNAPEANVSENIINEQKNYLDFVVEEDMYDIPKKSFSVTKLIAMIFGIISGLFLLYYTVELAISMKDQLSQYIEMGLVLPKSAIIVQYLPVIFLLLISLCPVVAGLLPKRFSKCSVLLFAIPVSYAFVDFIPQVIASLVLNISLGGATVYILVSIAGVLCLASAILRMFTKADPYFMDDEEFDFFKYEEEFENQDEEISKEQIEDVEIEAAIEEIENKAATEEDDFAQPIVENEDK